MDEKAFDKYKPNPNCWFCLKGSISNKFIENSCLRFLCPSSTVSSLFLGNLRQLYVLIGGVKDGIIPLGFVYSREHMKHFFGLCHQEYGINPLGGGKKS